MFPQPGLDILRLDRPMGEGEESLDLALRKRQGIDHQEAPVQRRQAHLVLGHLPFRRFPATKKLPGRLVLLPFQVVGDPGQRGQKMLLLVIPIELRRVHPFQEDLGVLRIGQPCRIFRQVLEVLERRVAQGFQEQRPACLSPSFRRRDPDPCPYQVVLKRALSPVPSRRWTSIGSEAFSAVILIVVSVATSRRRGLSLRATATPLPHSEPSTEFLVFRPITFSPGIIIEAFVVVRHRRDFFCTSCRLCHQNPVHRYPTVPALPETSPTD